MKKGKHKGKEGKVTFYRTEGDGGRLTLLLSDDSYIYVDSEDIDYKYDTVSIELMIPEDERAAWRARIKELKENTDEEYGY